MDSRVEYVLIEKENLSRYRNVILEDIFEELLQCGGELLEHYFCLGAVEPESRKVLAALVAEMEMDGGLNLLSLFVEKEVRRRGIAAALFDRLLRVAASCYSRGLNLRRLSPGPAESATAEFDTDESATAELGMDEPIIYIEEQQNLINVKTLYSLTEEAEGVWEQYLKAVGFTDFLKLPDIFWLDSRDLADTEGFAHVFEEEYVKPKRFQCVQELPIEEQEELVTAAGALISPEYSFVSGERSERETVVLVEELLEGEFQIHLAQKSPVTTEREWVAAIGVTLHAIWAKNSQFRIRAESANDRTSLFIKGMLGQHGRSLRQRAAWMDVVFTP